ncbi:hypothetical protein RDI58_010647 [Solanum bulbocastanum]|uniref:Uncharacterized protein n=1 Tax=Solanum bulbocastanum TaxID=147425 RepID=A0AAN8TTX6_SOLBU
MENQISMAGSAKTAETLDEGFAWRSVACPMKRMGNTQRLKASFEVIKQVARLTVVDWMAHVGSGDNSNLIPCEEHVRSPRQEMNNLGHGPTQNQKPLQQKLNTSQAQPNLKQQIEEFWEETTTIRTTSLEDFNATENLEFHCLNFRCRICGGKFKDERDKSRRDRGDCNCEGDKGE